MICGGIYTWGSDPLRTHPQLVLLLAHSSNSVTVADLRSGAKLELTTKFFRRTYKQRGVR